MKVPGFDKRMMAGPFGNASKEVRSITLASQAATTELEFMKLPAGTQLNDIKLIHDALGASTTLSVGLKYDSDEEGTTSATALLAAAASTSAGTRAGAFHPMKFDVPVTLTATIGGASATGKVSLQADYEYRGTK